jgi:SpoVK/Ycf46/Vps4 family AAA+-type ATPase
MWGPPGSGKTSTLQVIADQVINKGGVAIYVDNPDLAAKGLKQLRGVEPNRPLIIMLEDIDAIIEIHGESELLALMDGELQIDNVVFVATTNYPERLDKRFINRPSRFDVVKKIGMPSEKAREKFLREKCVRLADKANRQELLNWIKLSKGFSIAHLKELIVSVEVFEVKLEVAVERLKTMMDHSPKSSDGDGTFGFQ